MLQEPPRMRQRLPFQSGCVSLTRPAVKRGFIAPVPRLERGHGLKDPPGERLDQTPRQWNVWALRQAIGSYGLRRKRAQRPLNTVSRQVEVLRSFPIHWGGDDGAAHEYEDASSNQRRRKPRTGEVQKESTQAKVSSRTAQGRRNTKWRRTGRTWPGDKAPPQGRTGRSGICHVEVQRQVDETCSRPGGMGNPFGFLVNDLRMEFRKAQCEGGVDTEASQRSTPV